MPEVSASRFWIWSVFDRGTRQISPFQEIESDNPVFRYEMSRLSWPRTHSIQWLQRYVRRVSFVVPTILGLIAAGLTLTFSRYTFFVLFPTLAICVLVSLAADVYYTLVTINSISGQMESGHWEMLRLTTLEHQQIIAAKFGIAQVRAWRMAAWEVGLRTFVGVAYFVSVGYYQIAYGGRYWDELNLALSFAALLGVLIAFIAEPLWRMQTISALALAVSARGGGTASAALTAFGSVVGLRIVQVTLVWSALFASFRVIQLIISSTTFYDRTLITLSMCAAIVLTVALMAAFFRFIQRVALRRALQAAFRSRE